MGRILAIDFGRKRSGVAVTDSCRIIANGLDTVPTHTLIDYLSKYLQKEQVDIIVVGHPKQMDNTDSESMKYLRPFLGQLKKAFPAMPIEMMDERFTSVIAHKALIEGGAKKKTRQDKGLIDTMSATIILTSYLEQQRNLNF